MPKWSSEFKFEWSPLEHELYSLPLDFSTLRIEAIQDYQAKVKQLYKETYDKIAAWMATPEHINFITAIQPLINLELIVAKAIQLCGFSKSVHPSQAIREACAAATTDIDKVRIESESREDVFNVFRHYYENVYEKEADLLHVEECRYIEDMMQHYTRNGLGTQDAAAKQRIVEINQRISELSIQFETNIDEDATHFIFTKHELDGLPESFFSKERGVGPDQYKVTLKYPDLFPILDYANQKAIRSIMLKAYENRCERENIEILKEILLLRQEKALLLGYNSHAEYISETRLAGSAEKVNDFLDELNQRFTPLLDENLQALTMFARKREQNDALCLELPDIPYYMRLREEAVCGLNREEIKSYFPQDKVIQGTFDIYQKIFGLIFVERPNPHAWHEDVRYFDVYNADNEETRMGGFYLDLYPRDGKYAHAEACGLLPGCDQGSLNPERQIPLSAMICNFPKGDTLSFDDVTTFFHEFGHVIHYLCNENELACYHAFNAETDFIEAPSQMLENWCLEAHVLERLSAHPITGTPLPQAIISQLVLQETLHAGYSYKRQLTFGIFDFNIYSMSQEALTKLNLKDYFNQLRTQILQLPNFNTCIPAGFGHIVDGYDAGYYGYLLSKTYAMDMYASAFATDPLSQEQGMKYRKCILAPGSTKDGIELLRDFLGREPNSQAFFAKFGLNKEEGFRPSAHKRFRLFDERASAPVLGDDRSAVVNALRLS